MFLVTNLYPREDYHASTYGTLTRAGIGRILAGMNVWVWTLTRVGAVSLLSLIGVFTLTIPRKFRS